MQVIRNFVLFGFLLHIFTVGDLRCCDVPCVVATAVSNGATVGGPVRVCSVHVQKTAFQISTVTHADRSQ